MVKTTEKQKPTFRQIVFAKSLGINNPEEFSRKELALLIEQALKERKERAEVEERAEETEEIAEEEKEILVEYPGYTGILKPIRIIIPISPNRETLELMKRKRTSFGSPTLFREFLFFLKRVGAKKEENKIIIESNEVYDGPYLRTVIDSFFLYYRWEYIE